MPLFSPLVFLSNFAPKYFLIFFCPITHLNLNISEAWTPKKFLICFKVKVVFGSLTPSFFLNIQRRLRISKVIVYELYLIKAAI